MNYNSWAHRWIRVRHSIRCIGRIDWFDAYMVVYGVIMTAGFIAIGLKLMGIT